MKALIIGGGIAGPATALALRAVGIDSEIFETRTSLDPEEGLFLTLQPNGLRVLEALRLLDPVLATDPVPTPSIVFESGTGKVLGTVPNGRLDRNTPSVTLRRGTLQAVLAREARRCGIPVHEGRRFAHLRHGSRSRRDRHPGPGVRVDFEDGTQAEGDLLVGADGIHSGVRGFVDPGGAPPSYTGLVNLGGIVPRSGVEPTPGRMHMIWGRRAFFGYTVTPPGEAWWFANLGVPEEPAPGALAGVSTDAWRDRLLELFREDPPVIARILRVAPEIGAYPIHDLEPPSRWHRERCVLVGDAAHAVSPSSGQGASLALEDAVHLARCLAEGGPPEEAFSRFQAVRAPRVGRVRAEGRRRGGTKAPGALVRRIRDLVLPVALRLFATESRMRWLHDHPVPRLVPEPGR